MRAIRIGLRLSGWLALLISSVVLGLTIYLWGQKEIARRQLALVRCELIKTGLLKPIAELAPPPYRKAVANGQRYLSALEPLADLAGVDPEIFAGPEVMRLTSPAVAVPLAELTGPGFHDRSGRKALQTWEELRSCLAPGRPVAAAVAEILQNPVGFDYDYASLKSRLPMAELSPRLVAWLRSSAILSLHGGDTPAFLDDISAIAQVSALTGETYTIIAQTISIGLWHQGVFGLSWEALQSDSLNEDYLLRLQVITERPHFSVGFLRTLEMDIATVRDYFREFRRTGPFQWDSIGTSESDILNSNWAEAVREYLWRHVWIDADEARVLRQNAELLQIMQAFVKHQAIDPLRLASPDGEAMCSFDRWRFPMSTVMNFRHLIFGLAKSIANIETSRELILTAIALQRYQLRYGRPPDTLAALVPDYLPQLPLDWFDGQSLKYRLGASGQYTLYAVGSDGVDNGGDPSPVKGLPKGVYSWTNGRDLVWPRAEKAQP